MADAWPTTNIVTTDMDAGSDNAGVARADINLMAGAVNDMMGQPPMGSGFNEQTGTTYSIATSDNGKLVVGNHATNITVTLLAAATAGAQFKNEIHAGHAAGTVTITGTVGALVNPVLYPGDTLKYYCNGTVYEGYIIPFSNNGGFSPTIQDISASDAEGQTYSLQRGFWMRSGKLCHVSGNVITTSMGTLSGSSVYIANLPFTGITSPSQAMGIGLSTGMNITAGQNVTGIVNINTARIQLYLWDNANGPTALTVAEIASNISISFFGSYEVKL